MTVAPVSPQSIPRRHAGVYKTRQREDRNVNDVFGLGPPASSGAKLSGRLVLSGMTCYPANVTERESIARLRRTSLVFVATDTAHRPGVPGGSRCALIWTGDGSMRRPRSRHTREMTDVELRDQGTSELVVANLQVDETRQLNHWASDGRARALHDRPLHPARYQAATAFSPIAAPSQVLGGSGRLAAISATTRKHGASMMRRTDRGWRQIYDFLVDIGHR